MTNEMTKEAWIADELLMLEDGGEMPEVAYHSTINFLCHDDDGPHLELDENDLRRLKKGVIDRYRWIILRDLQPENRFTSIYRGLARSAANWQRLKGYGRREGFAAEIKEIGLEVGRALGNFLRQEYEDVIENGQSCTINCPEDCLRNFGADLPVDLDKELPGWRRLFVPTSCRDVSI